MKIKLHIPTEQYGFVEAEFDWLEEGKIIDPAEAYKQIGDLFRPQEGLSPKDFNQFLDKYLTENTGDLEVYNGMSDAQKAVIQEIKKAFKRLNK